MRLCSPSDLGSRWRAVLAVTRAANAANPELGDPDPGSCVAPGRTRTDTSFFTRLTHTARFCRIPG